MRPASTRKAISTGAAGPPRPSTRRDQTSHSSRRCPRRSVTRRLRALPGDRTLDDRLGHPGAAHPQAPDVLQEQQDPGRKRAQRRGYLADGVRGGHAVVVEGKDEERPGGRQRLHRHRPDVVLDPEVLARAVDTRGPRVGVHRLEADAELADRGEVPGFPALADPADAADVGLGERPAVVPQLQPVREQLEDDLGRAGVLGVLDQLEDEVGPLAVQLSEQVQHGGVPAVPGDILLADLLVVSRHRCPPPCCVRAESPARGDDQENGITWS